ncbi:preprotein translocase subunit SecY [Blattabacterium cuenoti]|uniref:preprotein translocase subunit SecY n=1 Tax=Blattabacterium cuenoti TaxID=1653831 RepID=UPI00163CAF06|nr:preprotein translocase subunit SecY [Blattabacterium cuenoti]
MGNFLKNIHNIWRMDELRNKIASTICFLLIYRFCVYIPIPGINSLGVSSFFDSLYSGSKGLMQILSSFTGGAFNRASIFALGIMPYISSSIIMQLMSIMIPFLQKLQRDGESGREQINFITRCLTIVISIIQSMVYLFSLIQKLVPYSHPIFNSNSFYGKFLFLILGTILLTSGTMFTVWIGDNITDRGIGNGISIIIMSGIISRFPEAISKEFFSKIKNINKGIIILFFEFFLWLIVILFTIFIIQAVRKIPVQYVSHYRSFGLESKFISNKKHQYIPLKITSAGVMPIIFSQSIMLFPLIFSHYSNNESFKNFLRVFQNVYGFWYNITIFTLVVIFTFFYTAITMPVNQIADELKRNGGHIPKIRPGKETSEYIDKILSYVTLPGSMSLAFVAILPSIVFKMGINQSFSLFYGGTSLLIVVGVFLDIYQQFSIHLLNYYYDGLMHIKNK